LILDVDRNSRKERLIRFGERWFNLDRSAPIFRLALMGADENAQTQSETFELFFAPAVLQKLDDGWYIGESVDGQLQILPPPRYGDSPASAA
jgi:hypothetical protein